MKHEEFQRKMDIANGTVAVVAALVTDPEAAEKLRARQEAITAAVHVNRCREGCACRENE